VISVLRNGFIQAFARSLEGSISLRSVKRDLREVGETQDGGEDDRKRDRDSKEKTTREAKAEEAKSGRGPHKG
jgi:hypothetical protein